MITPNGWMLTKSGNKLVFGHSPQTLTIGVVRMLYPRDMEHIGYNIRCDNCVRTSDTSKKKKLLNNQIHACWSKTPGSTRMDM